MNRDYVLVRLREILYRSGTPDSVQLYAAVEANLFGAGHAEEGEVGVMFTYTWKEMHLPEQITADVIEERILGLLRNTPKPHYINAIKEWRRLTGLGLKESKDAVDELAARYGIEPRFFQVATEPATRICLHMDCTGELRAIPGSGVGSTAAIIGWQCPKCGQNYSRDMQSIPRHP